MRIWVVFLVAFVMSCGGGGGGSGSLPFVVAGGSPTDGEAEASTDQALTVVFNRPADPATLTRDTIRLEQDDGTSIGFQLFVQGFNAAAVSIEPTRRLAENVLHRIVLSSDIRAADGVRLTERSVCFVTASVQPTVRPDQLMDLGDALTVPRYLARQVRLRNGKILIIGGYKNETEATDTLEIYEPTTRSFRLLDARLTVPRAEHAATVLNDGSVLISGGVSLAGGTPLASTDIFSTSSEGVGPGPPMGDARRYHADSQFAGGARAMVSGGFGANGEELDTIEEFTGAGWVFLSDHLPRPTARGFQIHYDFDKVYFSPSNLDGIGAFLDGAVLIPRQEGDIRFRSTYHPLGGGRFVIFGGDTRSFVTFLFTTQFAWGASDFLRERRGAHSVTVRGLGGKRFLIAGGFNIAAQGSPALRTIEVYDALNPGPFGFPDVVGSRVNNVQLPIPFAGHVGFNEPDGATVLAGGVGDGSGPHSRRVVLILDNSSAPTVDCD